MYFLQYILGDMSPQERVAVVVSASSAAGMHVAYEAPVESNKNQPGLRFQACDKQWLEDIPCIEASCLVGSSDS